MKRMLAGLMCMMIVLSLCGCGEADDSLPADVKRKFNPTNREEKSSRNLISFYTGIDIPDQSKLVFYCYRKVFQGSEEYQYMIFLFNDSSAEWLEKNNFKKEENKKFREGMVSDMRWFGEEGIPKFYFPNFTGRYLLLDTSRTYFLYNNDSQALYVFYLTRKSFSYNLEDTND